MLLPYKGGYARELLRGYFSELLTIFTIVGKKNLFKMGKNSGKKSNFLSEFENILFTIFKAPQGALHSYERGSTRGQGVVRMKKKNVKAVWKTKKKWRPL